MDSSQPHFLILTLPTQGHINPALHLSHLLATSTSSRITFSTTISAHLRPTTHHPLISFVPFSDGYDDGFNDTITDHTNYMSQFALVGSKSVTNLVPSLSSQGHPVTCIIYTFMLPWAADVARHLGIPSVLYWIQPATVFSVYYRYFHGYDGFIESHSDDPSFPLKLPNLPLLETRDLPSFLIPPINTIYSFIFKTLERLFRALDRGRSAKVRVLVNTFDALETEALASIEEVEMIGIGPSVTALRGDIFEHGTEGYMEMEWLDSKPPRSVVYVSLGTVSVVPLKQMEEISKGLEEGGRDFLWVVNKMQRDKAGDSEIQLSEVNNERGMVVKWCNQIEVLSHPSIGCFVTHCGWNSTVESLVLGVPTVGMPQWTDQVTNAKLVEDVWGTGVRARVSDGGVVAAEEIVRCLNAVMGEAGVGIWEKAEEWTKKAFEAMREGGSSYCKIRKFVDDIGGGLL